MLVAEPQQLREKILVWSYIYNADGDRISYPGKDELTKEEVAAKRLVAEGVINNIGGLRHIVNRCCRSGCRDCICNLRSCTIHYITVCEAVHD